MLKHESILKKILSQPTAPFREHWVIEALESILKEHKVPFFRDPSQNLIVGAPNLKALKKLTKTKSAEPLRIAIAHMDHPGFHATKWLDDSRFEFQWHGGSPFEHLVGAKVWLRDDENEIGSGVIESVTLHSHGRSIDKGVVKVENLKTKSQKLYGGFVFREPYWIEDSKIYTQVADDLIGCFAIVSTFLSSKKKTPFIGLITRAEEVGFIGAIAHFELGLYKKAKRPVVAISLETSRQLPNAEIGKGPIVRLGDRKSVFHSAYTNLLSELAQKLLPGKHQRRIMDGGSCEGTAATSYGIPTIAMSIPLGNYHNQSLEGGPDAAPPNGPAPEFVAIEDIAGMQTLLLALMDTKLPWKNPYAGVLGVFKNELKKYKPLLKLKI